MTLEEKLVWFNSIIHTVNECGEDRQALEIKSILYRQIKEELTSKDIKLPYESDMT